MSQKAVWEADGKRILAKFLQDEGVSIPMKCVHVRPETDLAVLPTLPEANWLHHEKLVVKPDQLIKRRGKAGLLGINLSYDEVVEWINARRNKEIQVEHTTGILDTFIIEPFVPHEQEDEYYVCIYSERNHDVILFYEQGGVDIGDVNAKAASYHAPLLFSELNVDELDAALFANLPAARKPYVSDFVVKLFKLYQKLHFTYLEINPLVYNPTNNTLLMLDLAAKLDETAAYEANKFWISACPHHAPSFSFPAPFGRQMTKEEEFIHDLDSKSGSSLKLTILNPRGRIATLIAGGGASVCFADVIADFGEADNLINYGEYSGAPTLEQTYLYAKTLFDVLTAKENSEDVDGALLYPQGKVLLIGGAIANFTDVAATFKGIIKALKEFHALFIKYKITIYVRRGGPNYQEGLRLISTEVKKLNIPISVFGPELSMTAIVPMALGIDNGAHNFIPKYVSQPPASQNPFAAATPTPSQPNSPQQQNIEQPAFDLKAHPQIKYQTHRPPSITPTNDNPFNTLFSPSTTAIVYGMQRQAVQSMLDYDFVAGRERPSVAALVYTFQSSHPEKFYWGKTEILIPCFQTLSAAMEKCPTVDTVVSFASMRAVYESTLDMLNYSSIKTIALIAEGVPERYTRLLIRLAEQKKVTLVGPATVGGVSAHFRIGNSGGMIDNVLASKLYRPGSVAYVTKSGGLSNELNNLLSRNTDGVYEGIALGGDRYPGSTFTQHLLRYQQDPNVKMLVLIGEVGGVIEYEVCELLKEKKITKPLVAWCLGTIADKFSYDVQFGHAGASAGCKKETAKAKNDALKAAGAIVPDSFDGLAKCLNDTYAALVECGEITLFEEQPPPHIPMDYNWASKMGLVRKSSNFISTISNERGAELKYAGVGITEIIQNHDELHGLGYTMGLLWFKKKIPPYFAKFIEIVLTLCADHGSQVSGAHNAIVAARAKVDNISALASGLLTIGPRFGGALNDAATTFYDAFYEKKWSPDTFVNQMRLQNKLIPGIGHKIRSINDPDSRVTEIKKFIKEKIQDPYPHINFPLLDYALQVEQITTKKKGNLILNVDGAIAIAFIDLWMAHPDLFSQDDVKEYIDMGMLNGFFTVSRAIGFLGHIYDQHKNKQPLYRAPDEDVLLFEDY